MSGILEGIRVLDLGVIQVGPYAGAMLGDLGAEVIKVEGPGAADMLRALTFMTGINMCTPEGVNVPFEDGNHSKKGLSIDLKKPEGREIFYKLIEKSDVFVSNYREEALKRMGLDYDTLCQHNPRLIWAHASVMGTKGPDRQIPGNDLVGQARSGIMMQAGEEGMPPIILPPGMVDRITSIFLAYGILAALIAREKTGKGQKLETSMLSSMINLLGFTYAPLLLLGKQMPRWNKKTAVNPVYNYYQCKDGRWLVLALSQVTRYFSSLCKALGLEGLTSDPRFANDAKVWENMGLLLPIMENTFASKPADEWAKALKEEDLLFSIIQTYSDVLNDPQALANDYIVDWDHPVMGSCKYYGFPVKFSDTPMQYASAAPQVGQHTEEILQDILGYDWDRLDQLRQAGVF